MGKIFLLFYWLLGATVAVVVVPSPCGVVHRLCTIVPGLVSTGNSDLHDISNGETAGSNGIAVTFVGQRIVGVVIVVLGLDLVAVVGWMVVASSSVAFGF